ncbi:MAG: hypothetical protein WKG07_10575 [Hymenobacter sp.]
MNAPSSGRYYGGVNLAVPIDRLTNHGALVKKEQLNLQRTQSVQQGTRRSYSPAGHSTLPECCADPQGIGAPAGFLRRVRKPTRAWLKSNFARASSRWWSLRRLRDSSRM